VPAEGAGDRPGQGGRQPPQLPEVAPGGGEVGSRADVGRGPARAAPGRARPGRARPGRARPGRAAPARATGPRFHISWSRGWLSSPAWFYTPFYGALGWVAVTVLPPLAEAGGGAVVALIVVGGVAYSLGRLAYALRRPDPVPDVYGYHEVFHTCTLVGFATH
jgi:Haemolysin-III related